jgi:cytochrome c oxidase cbb3-type subunit 3
LVWIVNGFNTRKSSVFSADHCAIVLGAHCSALYDLKFMKRTYPTQLAFWLLMAVYSTDIAAQAKPASTHANHPSSGEGAQNFSAYCASCHGLDGRGGERAPAIATTRKLQKASDSDIAKIVREGITGTGMPSFRTLGELKIQGLVKHLRALQGMDSATTMPGSPQAGSELFFGKASCSQCHMANGTGGFLGSDLSTYARGRSVAEIRTAVTEPASDRGKAVLVTANDGAQFEGIVRNEDNFSLQLQTRDGAFHFFEKSGQLKIDRRAQPVMPTDYASQLSAKQLDDIVSFLIQLGQSTKQPDDSDARKAKGAEE